MDMDGGSESGTKVGGAVGDVTKMFVIGELGFLFNLSSGIRESLEDLKDITTLLHGDDSKLIFFVNPDKEVLGFIVEDTSSFWPFSLKTASLEIFITTLEEEMIGNELLSLIFSHGFEGVVSTGEVTFEFFKSRGDEFLNLLSVFFGDGRTKWEISEVSGNSNSSGLDHGEFFFGEWWAVKIFVVH